VAGTLVVPVVDEGLGNSAYLVGLGEGRALAVDAPRDLRAVRAAAGRYGLSVAFAAETHLHADFLSGARSWPPTPARRSWLPPPEPGPSITGGWPTGTRPTWAA
jgi:glyoxylase-like metal-dependent hydrolase (beta-lactamase superfamily II)